MENFDLVVVSHLRWSFVWQRPQQLLSRLARHHRILFVEEPVVVDESSTSCARLQEVHPNIVVLTPQLSSEQAGETPLWLWPGQEEITQQVNTALSALDFRNYALWFYTPIPEFLSTALRPMMLVYDVMDELSNFKFAPPELPERERSLLRRSEVVFTGGASLYDAKKQYNPNTHLFASGVDSAHYRTACDPETTVPDWMQALPGPRAAYIGVIDERMDYDIIAAMAQARPDVQFAMCGPIVKVDPATLPQAPNLHYPGQQSYADLPRILKGCQVCLMPFARNEATRYISPTKTLEYMATFRPIVSTPINDVVRFYSDIVYLAETPEQFAEGIGHALDESLEDRRRKQGRIEKILAEHAWDAIAENMHVLMLASAGISVPVSRPHAGAAAVVRTRQTRTVPAETSSTMTGTSRRAERS
jgi:glycosyltransferase involved in cell wall biosynthesis